MNEIKIEILEGPLSADCMPPAWKEGEYGALLTFFGVVRERNHGRLVSSVFYEAFRPLAHSTLAQICEEAFAKFQVAKGRIYLAHSEGDIRPGETSLAVVIATPHRFEAFSIAQYVIDELKKRAPIWKFERYQDGTSAWLRGCALPGAPHT